MCLWVFCVLSCDFAFVFVSVSGLAWFLVVLFVDVCDERNRKENVTLDKSATYAHSHRLHSILLFYIFFLPAYSQLQLHSSPSSVLSGSPSLHFSLVYDIFNLYQKYVPCTMCRLSYQNTMVKMNIKMTMTMMIIIMLMPPTHFPFFLSRRSLSHFLLLCIWLWEERKKNYILD